MIFSHKRLLLSECGARYGKPGPDSVEVICQDGKTFVNVMILASLVPWLKEDLLYQHQNFSSGAETPSLVVKSLPIKDLDTFMDLFLNAEKMVKNSNSFDQHSFEKAAYAVCQNFNIVNQTHIEYIDSSIDTDDILFEENVSTVEFEQISTALTELNVAQLSDKSIVQNFSNQDGHLVCLVCYKIFTSNLDSMLNFRTHLSTHSLSIRRWGHLISDHDTSSAPVEQENSSKLKPCKKSKPTTKAFKAIVRDPKWYSCCDCNKRFKKATLLNQHQFKQHGLTPPQAQYTCFKCQFKSANLAGLKAHQRKHEEKFSVECQSCGRQFGESRCLEAHVKSGICKLENRSCSICSKVFADPTRLRIHKLTHTGEKPWSCDICQKSFSQRRSLKEHEAIHSERPHGCSHCPKRFVQKNHLKYHVASCHGGVAASALSGELKHVCKICSRSYAFPFQLRNHEAQHVNKLISHFRASEQETSDFDKK